MPPMHIRHYADSDVPTRHVAYHCGLTIIGLRRPNQDVFQVTFVPLDRPLCQATLAHSLVSDEASA
jgi:hypothetical protein